MTIAPPPAAFEQRVSQLDAQEHRAQVGGHHRIPFLHAGLQQGLGDLQGGVVDQGIQGAGEGVGLVEDRLQVLTDRDIGLDEQAALRECLAERERGPPR